MRFGAKNPARFESGPNLTPLVDVVMVILIFLMLVGQFIGNDRYMQQQSGLLEQGSQSAASSTDPLDQTITVNVTRTGDRFTASIDGKGVQDPEQVAALLIQKHEQLKAAGLIPATDDGSDAEGKNERVTVAISPAPNVPSRDFMAVYDAALQAKFKKVTFTVRR
ncbi:MAG: biopolymer transporter ExbD [Tepidisphaeraceae bacterium]